MTRAQKKAAKSTWSPAARAKRLATFAARRAAREAGHPSKEKTIKFRGKLVKTRSTANDPSIDTMRDVISFLEHAERSILKSGAKRITGGESYAMLALTTLRGG
jgi:hypothetical protein